MMRTRSAASTAELAWCCAALCRGALAGCSGRDADLDRFIDATKKEPGGRVEPLPEVKPYEAFTYADQDMRSPFVPGGSGGRERRASRQPSQSRVTWNSTRSTR